ncbi:MAG: 4-hydroxy-3-methylbut-2-enyl diphosphate reductase [Candidatus Omnitrophica bacterium]|nr:4-hydroxy-3-methylbut-2-enyl diphosphate reductase [Candidatus Omnitrophota bacterium]MDE2009366.1 4-hydroxy-3-methylbut-2-enyl diphosphate reductase [Candidatus Omnitrophota bacterium]MDE2214150.1 4-hydroxy-3-methylbut-2-enyl diphosphate reductase [Candidatus Omnitrophota bacterium]MDE2231187.1 4-hydroxy-3-methylbut-2-enyl diphosphate reductase [Candidatus Omnitrophota bacterium]
MEIFLAKTQGFCAGVASAIDIVELALKTYGSPLFVYHDIVHNTSVVNDMKARGIKFVEDLKSVPPGSRIIFSAHGIPPDVIGEARQRHLKFVDATCPLVTKVHKEAVKFSDQKVDTVLIGHVGHQELIGTSGYVHPGLLHIIEKEEDVDLLDIDPQKTVAYLTQTTLSVDETKVIIEKLKAKFPKLTGPLRSDICYATQNRQDAVKDLAGFCDIIIICGSPHSSNSNRLRETGEQLGVESYIVDTAAELDCSILRTKQRVGLSSGASVPRYLVDEIIGKIKGFYPGAVVHEFSNPEKNIVFPVLQFKK